MCFKNKFDLLTNFSASFDRKKMKFRHMSTEKASDFPSQNISCELLLYQGDLNFCAIDFIFANFS